MWVLPIFNPARKKGFGLKKFLEKKFDWQYYGGHHLENRITSFFHSVYSPQKFGTDYRNNALSARVRNGKMKRISAWKEYKEKGTVHGEKIGSGLRESEQFQQPLFTPSTKATSGHDENISFLEAIEILGSDLAEKVKDASLNCYKLASDLAMERGIIIADTKFEFGLIDGELVLADEVLTPDSSRFWPEDQWEPGFSPPSFDKQPVRDFLDSVDWDKQPPPPNLPSEVISATSSRYIEAYEKISGKSFRDWPGARS